MSLLPRVFACTQKLLLVLAFIAFLFLTFSLFNFKFSISTVSASHGPSRPSPCDPLGDADRNGIVDEHDLDFIANPANNLFGQNTPLAQALADVNGDDVVTTGDIFIIERYILGEIDDFEACVRECDLNSQTGDHPAPCTCQKAAQKTGISNYVTDENGEPPPGLKFPIQKSGPAGQSVDIDINQTFTYTVDFSKLQALFGTTNSDYLEGKYQDGIHRQAELLEDIYRNHRINYFGPGQKSAPRVMTDQLRLNYVKYIWEHPSLPEASDGYTDLNGNRPLKTVWEIVLQNGGVPPDDDPATDAPTPPSLGGNENAWQASTWARYWPKLPTAYSEFYDGTLMFHPVIGQQGLKFIQENNLCPLPLDRQITFVIPNFFRTAAVAGQLNQIVVPSAAQSDGSNNIILQAGNSTSSALASFVKTCFKIATQNPLSKALGKVIKISMENLKPIKTAYAQSGSASCIKVLVTSKFGKDPYCALPADQLNPPGTTGESCTNANDEFRLDLENENVVCTFNIQYQRAETLTLGTAESSPPGAFDSCTDVGAWASCSVEVRIYPNFVIPWILEIWNNALYSDQNEQEGLNLGTSQVGGVNTDPITGRPGVYTFFTPKNLFEDEETKRIKVPGQAVDVQTGDSKERFVGGVDCSKYYVKRNALYPLAAQRQFGDNNSCAIFTASDLIQPSPPGTTPPGNVPPNNDNCGGFYLLDNPLGNFGDPNCDFSENGLYLYLQSINPSGGPNTVGSADWWFFTVAPCESNYNPNSYRSPTTGPPFTPDPNGAWGLYQMGSTGHANATYDFGNVEWHLQSDNAKGLLAENGVGYWDPNCT